MITLGEIGERMPSFVTRGHQDYTSFGIGHGITSPCTLKHVGDSYAAYPASLLEQNMKAMHKTFSGVELIYAESN